eukprot:6602465-Pyramimonas_sp.AAC.2
MHVPTMIFIHRSNPNALALASSVVVSHRPPGVYVPIINITHGVATFNHARLYSSVASYFFILFRVRTDSCTPINK